MPKKTRVSKQSTASFKAHSEMLSKVDGSVEIRIPVAVFRNDPSYTTEPAAKLRAVPDEEAIERYAEQYGSPKGIKSFPPILIFEEVDDQDKVVRRYLADGLHRITAVERAGKKYIWANVVRGNRYDAVQQAVQANATHGVRWRPEDRRAMVRYAMLELKNDRSHRELSNRTTAKLLDISPSTVDRLVRELEAEGVLPRAEKRVASDGRRVPGRPGLSAENQKRIADGWKAGKSPDELGKELGRTPQTIRRYIKQINTRDENLEEPACKESDDLPVNQADPKASPNAAKAHPEPAPPSTAPLTDPGVDVTDADAPLLVNHDPLAPDNGEEELVELNTVEVTKAEADCDLAIEDLIKLLAALPEDCREAHAEATILLVKTISELAPDHTEAAIDHLQDRLNGLLRPDQTEPMTRKPVESAAT